MKSELFFLKQYGFTETLLNLIYKNNYDPLDTLFNQNCPSHYIISRKFTNKEKKLVNDIQKYHKFKTDLYVNEFLTIGNINKMYFKYDKNIISTLIPVELRPLFMYASGDYSLLDEKTEKVAIVGTRKPTKRSIENAQKITEFYVSENKTIISGLAEGIDTIAHETALKKKGKTISIIPTNFKDIYPASNKNLAEKIRNVGLLISSIGPSENTHKSSFLERNQYVANICDLLIVVETNLTSGTMNTIRNASEARKKILFYEQQDEEINDKILNYGGVIIDD